MFSLFKMSPRKMRDQQLHSAQISLVQHKQAAAYHSAMSTYLSGEVSRLSAEVAAEKEVAKFDATHKVTPPAARPMAVPK
jgi:hypothetical protein